MRHATTRLMAAARARRAAVRWASSSTLQPDLRDPVPVLDAPAPGVVLDDPAAVLGRVHGQGGEQQPADRRCARGRALLLDEHAVQAHQRFATVFAAGGREFDGVGVKCQGGASAGAAGTRGALAALRARGQPVDGDHSTGAHGRGTQGVEQRPPAGDAAPPLDPHQEVDLGRARCSSNRRKSSASRSITHTSRPGPSARVSSAQSRKPSIQRALLRSCGALLCPSPRSAALGCGATNRAFSTPSGRPLGVTASVECRCRPRVCGTCQRH